MCVLIFRSRQMVLNSVRQTNEAGVSHQDCPDCVLILNEFSFSLVDYLHLQNLCANIC